MVKQRDINDPDSDGGIKRAQRKIYSNYPNDWRSPHWCRERGILWENWSINGEVCIKGIVPPFSSGPMLAHCLTWLVREFASSCRRTFNGTGALAFLYYDDKSFTILALSMALMFDLALQDSRFIRDHIRWRGGNSTDCEWPKFWLEGERTEYLIPGVPLPRGRVKGQRFVIIADECQVFVPNQETKLCDSVIQKWSESLERLARVDEASIIQTLRKDEQAFLVNIMVLVHEHPPEKIQPRPTLEESFQRHEGLIAELAPIGEEKGLPVPWHALWKIPAGMKWKDPAGKSWMRYPAVSFVMGVRRLEQT